MKIQKVEVASKIKADAREYDRWYYTYVYYKRYHGMS